MKDYGDSGSWIIEKNTARICGHIVAGYPELGVVYISPAYRTFKDIENQLNCQVYLAIEYQDVIEQGGENVATPRNIIEGTEPKAWRGEDEKIPSAKPETLPPASEQNKIRASGSGATNVVMSASAVEAPVFMSAEEPSIASTPTEPPSKQE